MTECACGGEIRLVALPAELAKASGSEGIWVHTDHFSTLCYEDDLDCHAEPYEKDPSAGAGLETSRGDK